MSIHLKGITWNHTRGFTPLAATAQRFEDTHPGIEISWRKRSLAEFADLSITDIAREFDFIVIDYPFAGNAAADGYLLPLDEYLPDTFLTDQAANSVGKSHESYGFGGHQWGLATDAAAPAASWRPDLLDQLGQPIPRTWQELLELARRGVVAPPGIPVDALCHWYMLCDGLGEEPFQSSQRVVSEEIGLKALELLKELFSLCSPECLNRNPIRTYEAMTTTDDIAYCPFAFAYSNYARPQFARRQLKYGGLVEFQGKPLRSALGGAGISISSFSKRRDVAIEYALYVNGPECQRSIYFATGGQPGHRAAWLDPDVNAACSNFFRDILPTLDNTMLRPVYNGHVEFQDFAGRAVHRFLATSGDPKATVTEIEELYRNERR